MAHIRKRPSGKLDKFGNPIVRYQVVWSEPVRDSFGAPTGKFKQTSETFATERKAKAHLREVENALDSARGVDPSSQKAKANTPLGTYARQYLDSLAGQIDPTTIQGYEKLYHAHIAPVFGSKPVASITTADVTSLRAQLLAPHQRRSFVTRGKPNAKRAHERRQASKQLVTRSPKTVKQIIGMLKRILNAALEDRAIASNPVIANRPHTTKRQVVTNVAKANGAREPFRHRPLTASQVASVHDWIARGSGATESKDAVGESKGKGNPVYALAVLFTAYTGVRAAELQGLQVQDVTLSDIPGTVGAVRIVRTATRRRVEPDQPTQWIYGTPKSDASTNRVVPLAPWLADDLRDYLTNVHPFSATNAAGNKYVPHAPLFPGRRSDSRDFDWAKPVVVDNLYHNYFQPACKALGLGNVRWHDLRHTFATLALSAGEHYMQVSKWLGHSSFVLTLTTYADYIREDGTAAPNFTRPVANGTDNVVDLERRKSGTA